MSSHEDFYNTPSSAIRPLSQSFPSQQPFQQLGTASATPPAPPPKPTAYPPSQSQSQQPSRTSTPVISSNTGTGPPLPPLPPTPRATSVPNPGMETTSLRSAPPHLYHTSTGSHPVPPPQLHDNWLPTHPPLASYSTADLHPLLSSPSNLPLLSALAKSHPSHASSLAPLSAQLQSNIQLATHLQQLETQLLNLRDQTTQLLLQHTSLQSTWRRKQSEMDDALSPWSARAMYQRLVSSINEQEAVLRAVQESFLEGGGGGGDDEYYGGNGSGSGKASEKEVSEWVRRIREGTTVLEKRREMRARWDEGRVGGWR